MTLIETGLVALPVAVAVGIAALVRSCGPVVAGTVGAGVVASAMIFSARVPKITYYDRSPLNTAGVYSEPFAEGLLIAILAVLFFDGCGVPRWAYLPPASLAATAWFLSQSWIA